MPKKYQNEDSGLSYKKNLYTTLGNTWVYSCPKTINCLCPNNEPRTVMDQYYINKTGNFPVSNKRLGWKL